MNGGTLTVARIGGIAIKVHWIWALVVLLFPFQ